MEQALVCPRTEICYVYRIYVDNFKDDRIAIVEVTTIESGDFYSCRAFAEVMKLMVQGRLAEEVKMRLQGAAECLMIEQANRLVERRRPDY